MISLSKINLQDSIEIDGHFYKIHTDFRYWLLLSRYLKDTQTHLLTDFDFLYCGVKTITKKEIVKRWFFIKSVKITSVDVIDIPTDRQIGINALMGFMYPKKELPRVIKSDNTRVLDYELDAEYIYAAFMEQYQINLLDPKLKLHWHEFLALLSGLHDTKLNEIMSYRSYDDNDKSDYKKSMQQAKRVWSLPEIMTAEDKAALDKFDNLFK